MKIQAIITNLFISIIDTIIYVTFNITLNTYGVNYPDMTEDEKTQMENLPYKEAVKFYDNRQKINNGFEIAKLYFSSLQTFLLLVKDSIPIFITILCSLFAASLLQEKHLTIRSSGTNNP